MLRSISDVTRFACRKKRVRRSWNAEGSVVRDRFSLSLVDCASLEANFSLPGTCYLLTRCHYYPPCDSWANRRLPLTDHGAGKAMLSQEVHLAIEVAGMGKHKLVPTWWHRRSNSSMLPVPGRRDSA